MHTFLIMPVAVKDPVLVPDDEAHGHLKCFLAKWYVCLTSIVEQVEEAHFRRGFSHDQLVDVVVAD